MTSLEDALATPGPGDEPRRKRTAPPGWEPGWTFDGENGSLTVAGPAEQPRTWDAFIRDSGLDPDEVTVIGPVQVRAWDAPRAGGDVVRMHYYRLTLVRREARVDVADLIARVRKIRPRKAAPPDGEAAFNFWAGDTQFGKADGDGPAGTVARYYAAVDAGVERLKFLRRFVPIGHVHLAWLGDCIEGFQSQGGTNAWRTVLTLTEQIQLIREAMLYTIRRFAPLAPRVTAVSIPGNHDEAVRFGKAITRYDDSHAVDSLVAVGMALRENPKTFGHVQLFTPGKDELTVTVDVAGTIITHAHGHQFRTGRHFDWWKGQAFGEHPAGAAHILAAGHLHHLNVDTSGQRTFIQVPALESESTWWRHRTGETGRPGAVTLVTRDGYWSDLSVV